MDAVAKKRVNVRYVGGPEDGRITRCEIPGEEFSRVHMKMHGYLWDGQSSEAAYSEEAADLLERLKAL